MALRSTLSNGLPFSGSNWLFNKIFIGKIPKNLMNILNKGRRTLETVIIVLGKGRQPFNGMDAPV
jgi:hypothetical protein